MTTGRGRAWLLVILAAVVCVALAVSYWPPRGAGAPSSAPYIGAASSRVVHRAVCGHVGRIDEDNRVGWPTLVEAKASGRRPCKHCRPWLVAEPTTTTQGARDGAEQP